MGAPKRNARAGGRKAGVPNKVTREIKELAQQYGAEALETLVEIMRSKRAAKPARVSAANIVLDRAYGKPAQAIEHSGPNGGPIQTEDVGDELRARALAAFLAKTGGKLP